MCLNPFSILPWFISRPIVLGMLYMHFIYLKLNFFDYENFSMLLVWSVIFFFIK